MPQLEVGTFASQIFWLIVTFSVLYYLFSRKALPRVSEILEARQDRIAADLDHAQRLRSEAEETLAKYEEQMSRARSEAHTLITETQARLQAEAAERQAELDRDLNKRMSEAEAAIAEAKKAALKELEEAAVSAAQAATERLIGAKITKKAAQTALKDAQKEAA